MAQLTIQPSGTVVHVIAGTPLLSAILAAGEKIHHKCDGKAECGSCHIFVLEGRKTLPRIQKIENEQLDALVGVSSKSRLACQTLMGEEAVTIELLSFV